MPNCLRRSMERGILVERKVRAEAIYGTKREKL
jgi:hypothetical protein